MADRGHSVDATSAARPPASGDAELFLLLRSSHLLASAVHELTALEPSAAGRSLARLSPSQSHLLRVICRDGKHPVGQVARLLGISTPAATKTVDKLERLGLVERHEHGDDRRTRLFSVSAAGRALVRRGERRAALRMRSALRTFAPPEAGAFTRMLARFSYSLLAGAPAPRGNCLRCAAYLESDCPLARARGGCPCDEFLHRPRRARRPRRGAR